MSAFSSITKIPELKRRIIFTMLMLAVYRLGCHIPTPGIDPQALMAFFAAQRGTIFGLFDMFSGGALQRFAVFALGIMPYISASIIIELLKVVLPSIEKLYKEGEAGQKKIKQYTRYGTVLICAVQGLGIALGLEQMTGGAGHMPVVMHPGWGFRLMTVITLTAGTAFIMWLGEMITERGIGNGISLIIFAGIVARLPSAIISTFQLISAGEIYPIFMVLLVIVMIGVVGFIVFVERAQRRIQVQYARRVVGRRMMGGTTTHLPLKVNTSGVIPPIFASSLLMFPATIKTFIHVDWVQHAMDTVSPGARAARPGICGPHLFLLLFLHRGDLQPGGRGGQFEEMGRLCPGVAARETHLGLYRPHSYPHHPGGRGCTSRRSACCPVF